VASAYRQAAAWRAGDVLLKPFRYGERQLYYATGALLHLERSGLTPNLVWTRAGERYARVGGAFWYATAWIGGRTLRLPADLTAACRSLARFHTAAEGYFMPYGAERAWPRRWQGLLADLKDFQARAQTGHDPFDGAYARAAPAFIRRAEAALAALAASPYARLEAHVRAGQRFCHRDCTAANLVRDEFGQVWFVDLDTAGPELQLHDLTRLLLSGPGLEPRAVLSALAAYESVLPLDPAERQLLPASLLLPREFWWAAVCRYRHARPGVDPERLLQQTITGAPARDACVKALQEALCGV
jgi:CotS family spore coat protein